MDMRLNVDSRRRISLAKLLPNLNIHAVMARVEGDKIILEPMAEIPARELWLHADKKALDTVKKGLQQKGKHYLGSFAKYVQEEDDEL
jgi:hypothetical protein